MTTVHHLNCGFLHAPPNPRATCHCLLLEDRAGLALVDTGIGLLDVARPLERIGKGLIELAGFQFREADTAARQVEALGRRAEEVTRIVLTHADPDHAGGLADFPGTVVHVSAEEHDALTGRDPRYLPVQFDHGPRWSIEPPSSRDWFGLEARALPLGFASEVLLVPLFGHTLGHCGVAVERDGGWLLHVGDAYYLRVELSTDDHPVSALAASRAADDGRRRAALGHLRRLARDHADRIQFVGYHDETEFPGALRG